MILGDCEYLVMASDDNGNSRLRLLRRSTYDSRSVIPLSTTTGRIYVMAVAPLRVFRVDRSTKTPLKAYGQALNTARRREPRKKSSRQQHRLAFLLPDPTAVRPGLVVDPPSERTVGPCPFCSGPENSLQSSSSSKYVCHSTRH